VIGYNVYRGTQSGGPYTRINPELDPNLDYTDIAVIDGQTYFYVTTSVNSENEESVYSNQAQATIPSSPRNTAMKISPSE
jgi:fibronectin type 3 domain-containing protein